MENLENADTSLESGIKRACDQCRFRKIKCDKENPCSNCRVSQRACSTTGVGQKPKVVRQRVLISAQYERKIDKLESRLANIEGMLLNLTALVGAKPGTTATACLSTSPGRSSNQPMSMSTHVSENFRIDEAEILLDPDSDPDSDVLNSFEGTSSMAAQTQQASEFLEHAVTQTSLRDIGPDMQNALRSLQQIVSMRSAQTALRESRFPHQKPMPKRGLKDLPMPSTHLVLSLLREIRETPPLTFLLVCAFIAIEDFTESCRKVYFATEDFGVATFIIVNAGLYWLFQEKSMQDPSRADELIRCHHMCRDNLQTVLSNLPLLLPPKRENLEALLLAASYLVETSRYSLAAQIAGAAAQMCVALGWHRLPSLRDDDSQDPRSTLFWFTYTLDKGMALRFGRASILQDYDIATPQENGMLLNRSTDVADPWTYVLNLWILEAETVGRAYEELYSPKALAKPPEQRVGAAKQLIAKLQEQMEQSMRLERSLKERGGPIIKVPSTSKSPGRELQERSVDMVIKSDQVSYWSCMTLVYRAIPAAPGFPSTFNAECIHAARMAFACHQECVKLIEGSPFGLAGYMHWTILYSPFVPFISLFCHVIETSDADDLHRLAEFVTSLEPVIAISEGIEKMHRLCQVLYNIARLYIEAKAKAQQQNNQDMNTIGNDFDMYLSQLGFMPQQGDFAGAGPDLRYSTDPMGQLDVSQTARLGDWSAGNKNIFGLMEEDLSQFSPGLWTPWIGPSAS